jgi:hypothetical protein
MTLSSTERRELASQMDKARDLRVVQLNPTMGTEAVGRVARSFVDDARTAARSKSITILMILK